MRSGGILCEWGRWYCELMMVFFTASFSGLLDMAGFDSLDGCFIVEVWLADMWNIAMLYWREGRDAKL